MPLVSSTSLESGIPTSAKKFYSLELDTPSRAAKLIVANDVPITGINLGGKRVFNSLESQRQALRARFLESGDSTHQLEGRSMP